MASQDRDSLQTGAQPPEESAPIQIEPIAKVAGGVPSVIQAINTPGVRWDRCAPLARSEAKSEWRL